MNHRLWLLLTTALAPLIWGSTYWVTAEFLPPNRPLTAATIRVLPAGLLLLAYTREFPARGDWGKTVLLGILNIGFSKPCCLWLPTVCRVVWPQF